MKKIKAFFFDVDGTLYSHRLHEFSASTMKTLQILKDQGYKIGIATSRCRFEMDNLPEFYRTFPFDAKVFDGGALVMEDDHILAEHPMDPSDMQKVVQFTNERGLALRYSTFDNDYIAHHCNADVLDRFFKLYLNMPNVKEYEAQDKVYNLIVYNEKEEQIEELEQTLTNSSIIVHTSFALEVTRKGIEKSKGIAAICEKWGLSLDEVACFGDGANDVAMVQAAGLGVAMANGHPSVRAAADEICGHVDEDGIYRFCKEKGFLD